MKFLMIFWIVTAVIYGNTISVEDGDKYITKNELLKILKTMFPENRNLKFVDAKKRNELYNNVLKKHPNKDIIKKLKYFHKRKNHGEDVLLRCDFLINNRTMNRLDHLEVLNICVDYEIKQYEYHKAISYLETILDINEGELEVREVIKKLIFLYEKEDNKEKVRYLKDIIND